MADTNTAKLGAVKPEVGSSSDTWGTKQNAAFDIFDAAISGTPATVASAATTDLSATTVPTINITGNVGITSFGNAVSGMIRKLFFTGTPLITNSANIVLLTGVNRQITAGDTMEIVSFGAGVWKEFVRGSVGNKFPTQQTISAVGAFVYTPTPGAVRANFQLVGGGGAGGNVDGQGANTGGAGGGGASGFDGDTGIIDITGAATFSGSIGAAGVVSGVSTGDGGNGGNTTITVGATTYTAGGGTGGGGMLAGTTPGGSQDGGAPGVGTNLFGASQPGGMGAYNGNGATNGTGGNGGSTRVGSGGKGIHIIAAVASGGLAGVGFGSGGSGATTSNIATNVSGGAGRPGLLRVTEYYN